MNIAPTSDQYPFSAPARGLSMDEAKDFILSGISECELAGGGLDSKRAGAWLSFCATCFIDEPYGQDLARECRKFVCELSSSTAGDCRLTDSEIEEMGVGALCGMATELLLRGDVKESYRLSSAAVGKASHTVEQWAGEGDGENLCFADSIEFSVYAISHAEEAVTWRNPAISQAFYVHGVVLYELGEYESALKFHESALALDPVSAKILLEMAECAKRLKDPDKVAAYAAEALKFARNLDEVAKAHRSIAYALTETNHLRWAAAHLLVAQDYVSHPLAPPALDYISESGYDVSEMTLEDAVRISKAEVNGYPVSDEIVAAYEALIDSAAKTDPPLTAGFLAETFRWSREFRHEAPMLEGL